MVMNDHILKCLVYEILDDPEEILEDFNIEFEDWPEEKIEERANHILDNYKVIETIEDYVDLERSRSYNKLIFEYEGNLYAVDYSYSPYAGIDMASTPPYKVEKISRTITIEEYVPCV